MKRVACLLVVIALMGGQRVWAARSVPVPEGGYWEIITRVTGPARTTVKFFDLEQHLIYEERLEGVRLDGTKRRTCRMLNKSLRRLLAGR
jgi:hypothetical protein